MTKRTIYLIRHATPDWERRDLPYHLPPGPPLTDFGQAEARALGAYLLAAGVRRLYASPLERTLHTAQIAAQISGAQVLVDDRLIEWQPGEDSRDVEQRTAAALQSVQTGGDAGASAGLVTHGGPIAVLLQSMGMEEAEINALRHFDRNNLLPPAGVWEAHRETEKDHWRLRLSFMPEGIEACN